MDTVWLTIYTYLATYGLSVLAVILMVVVGRWLASVLSLWIERAMERAQVDPTLTRFVKHLSYMGLLVFVALSALSQLGIQTTSFIAVLGAAGLAVGLALQGSLANFAAGVLMIIFRPFQVGDFIEAAGTSGMVQEIQIFNTILNTADNRRIIIPNASITTGNITNYSANDTRRLAVYDG
jgi:small conductance mechanosensitive channel